MAQSVPAAPASPRRPLLDEAAARLHPPRLVDDLGKRYAVAWHLLALLGIAAVAALLRFYRIDAQSLWYDEGISAYQLTRSYPEIVVAAAGDTHPPLYYWALKAWGALFGVSEIGLRSLSAVCGVAGVALTWLIGRRLFGAAAAACAALLLAVSPLAVYYAQEVRMYTFVGATGLLAVWAYLRRWDALYAVAALATLYAQYLGATFLLAINLHALLTWRRMGGRRGWLCWLLANAAVVVGFLPWLPTFVDQSLHRSLNTTPRTAEGLVGATLGAYGGGLATGDVAVWVGAALVVAALAGAGLGWARLGRTDGVALALLLWLVPLALVLALGLRNGLFESRYLLLGAPGLCLLAGLGVAQLSAALARPRYSRLVRFQLALYAMAGLLVPQGDALARQYFDPSLARDDYRGAVAEIERLAAPGDAIVLSAPNQVEVFSFYYHGPLPSYPLPARRPIDEADTLRRLEEIRARHERVWLVSWALRQADPRGVTEQWLAANGFQASHRWYGGVQLALYTLARPGAPTEQLGAELDNGITLAGYRLGSRSLRPGDTLALTLVWRAREAPRERWKVFTQVLDSTPAVVAQRDAEPGGSLRPTTTWQAGETVEDNYGILLPPTLAPGRYLVRVGMYLEAGPRASFAGGRDYADLGEVEVRP